MSPYAANQSNFWGPVRSQFTSPNDGARHVPLINSDLQIIIKTMPDLKRNPHAFTQKIKALQIAHQCSAYDIYIACCACLGVQITNQIIDNSDSLKEPIPNIDVKKGEEWINIFCTEVQKQYKGGDWAGLLQTTQGANETCDMFFQRMSEYVTACCQNANEQVNDEILRSALMSGFNKKVRDRIKLIRPEWRRMGSLSIMDLARNMELDIEDKEKARTQKVMYVSPVGPNGIFIPANHFKSGKHDVSNVTCYKCRKRGHYAKYCKNEQA